MIKLVIVEQRIDCCSVPVPQPKKVAGSTIVVTRENMSVDVNILTRDFRIPLKQGSLLMFARLFFRPPKNEAGPRD